MALGFSLRRTLVRPLIALTLLFPACDRKKANLPTPPTPQPVATAAKPAPPPPRHEPLSLPQTTVQLPPEQPVDPAALQTVPPPASERTESPSISTPRPARPVAKAPEPPAAGQPAAPAEQPRLQPILPENEQQRLANDIRARRAEIDSYLSAASKRRLNERDRATVSRVRSFLNLSDQAAKRGDMTAADELSSRALILARGLAK